MTDELDLRLSLALAIVLVAYLTLTLVEVMRLVSLRVEQCETLTQMTGMAIPEPSKVILQVTRETFEAGLPLRMTSRVIRREWCTERTGFVYTDRSMTRGAELRTRLRLPPSCPDCSSCERRPMRRAGCAEPRGRAEH